MARRRNTIRSHHLPESKKPESRANASSRNRIAGPLTIKHALIMCLLPIWLLVIVVFDGAIADIDRQFFSVKLPVAIVGLKQEQDADEIDDALRTHWVSTDADRKLTGRISEIDGELANISPIQELEIVLLQHGEVQSKADATDENGLFTLTDVLPGDYTLVASGPNGFLAYSVHVLTPLAPLDPDDASNVRRQPEESQYVSLSLTDPIGLGRVGKLDEFQIDAAAIPPKFLELERIVSDYLPSDAVLSSAARKNPDDLKPLEEELQISSGFKFALDEDGSFSGRVLPPGTDGDNAELTDMNIFLLQDDIEIHRVDVEKNGDFKIEDVEPGVYAVVAAGKDGFSALSFELVRSNGALSSDDVQPGRANEYYVSLPPAPVLTEFAMAIIVDPEDLKYCRDRIRELNGNDVNQVVQNEDGFVDGNFGLPVADNGFTGAPGNFAASGSAGRGGFPAGNGRFRTFLRGSAIAAAIVALGTIDGNPDPASPIQP